ncbi:hypothetical protein Tco_0074074 [Tanacetum coccineum]
MDDPNITNEEYISLEEEKARRCGKVYNWETATYGKIWYDEDVHDLRSVETEFPAIVFNDGFTSEVTLSCEPTISPLNNNKINFRIPFDESDDEDYTPTVSYFDDLDYFKNFEKEFSAIVYNDALTSKLDFLTEPTVSPQHIDEYNLKDETSLSKCDEEEQNVLYFNDLFPFNVIYPNDSKSDDDNDDDKIDIKQSSRGFNTAYLGEWIRRIDFLYSFRFLFQSLTNEYMEEKIALVFLCLIQDLAGKKTTTLVFYLAPGLKINIHKSNIYGVDVSSNEVNDMASITRCESGTSPFVYLGLPIGSNTNHTTNLKKVMERFHDKLSSWKSNLLSIGGRLTLCMGTKGGFDQQGCKINGLWAKIVGSSNHLHSSGVLITDLLWFKRNKDYLVIDRISNGEWYWNWSRSELRTRNMSSLNELMVEIGHMEITYVSDACVWSLANDGMFSVGVTRRTSSPVESFFLRYGNSRDFMSVMSWKR